MKIEDLQSVTNVRSMMTATLYLEDAIKKLEAEGKSAQATMSYRTVEEEIPQLHRVIDILGRIYKPPGTSHTFKVTSSGVQPFD